MKEDMRNWRRFVEQVTGKPYGAIKPEPPKKKNGDRREGGVGPEKTEVQT